MIAVDTNVLVYAHRAETGFHARAFDQLAEAVRCRALARVVAVWQAPRAGLVHQIVPLRTSDVRKQLSIQE